MSFVAYPPTAQASYMSIYTMPSLRDLSLFRSHAARGFHSSPLLLLYLHSCTAFMHTPVSHFNIHTPFLHFNMHTPRSAQTAEVLTAQELMAVWPRRSPSMHLGGGGHHPHRGGRRGGRLPVMRPRTRRGGRTYRRSRWRRQKVRSTGLWRSSGQTCFSSLSVSGLLWG